MLSLVSLITSSLNSLTGMPFMAVKQSSCGLCWAEGHCRYRTQAELQISTSCDALLQGALTFVFRDSQPACWFRC